MADIVIAAAARTPIGTFNGALAGVPAHKLGQAAITEAMKRAKIAAGDVSEVVFGQVLTAGAGMNPARQAAMAAGIPKESTAFLVNQVCGSGLRAVALGYQAIKAGDSDIVVAGGQESMSQSPHCTHLRAGTKMGNTELVDTMIKDGLWDVFNGYHMGLTAENVAREWQITREQQDQFALASQQKAEAAMKAGKFKDEIVGITIETRKGPQTVDSDEHPRHGTTLEALAKLRPAFSKDGTVTAGSASGINDGAAALVLMTDAEAAKRGVAPLARIVSWATAGVDPKVMGSGPIPASRAALKKAGWSRQRSRPRRGQRGLRRAGLRREQGSRLGSGEGERERRRHRARPSDRRLGRTHPRDAAPRDAEAQREEGPRHAVHRRRHGHRDVRRALRRVRRTPRPPGAKSFGGLSTPPRLVRLMSKAAEAASIGSEERYRCASWFW